MNDRASLALMALTLFVMSGGVDASNLSFLNQSPLGYFTDEDMRLMRAAAQSLLQDEAPGAEREWRNPSTGNSGRLQLLQVFKTTDGRDCKKVSVITRAHSLEQHSAYPLCRNPEGRWLIDTEATPAEH